ncbi:hypothetical protein [Rhizobium leguminosarum]|uniref:Uncharacterized protein n=1 Tax=Rhizobium leguminosarum TaxID=384 RepID=A0A7K3VUQ6_RHILE|nr:hypothetical protein [Rhizobium leguminosarum]NEK19881.1 hypothetical protein [Rhizobium leguminosarum]
MSRVIALFAISMIAVLWAPASAKSQSCSGSGCKYISLQNQNGCMVFVNKSDYKITISTGPGGHAPTVYAHSTVELSSVFYGCMKNLLRDYKATAHGVPPSPKKETPRSTPSEDSERRPTRQRPKPNESESALIEVRPPRQLVFEALNECNVPLVFWIKFLNIDRKWETKKFTIGPEKKLALTSWGVPVATENRIAYVDVDFKTEKEGWIAYLLNDNWAERVENIEGKPRILYEAEPYKGRINNKVASKNAFGIGLTCFPDPKKKR